MSNLITLFRRLLFRRRGTSEKTSGDSQKSSKDRTKSLNLPASTNNSLRDKNRTEIHVKRGSQVTIRNRSQSVIVERKHVSSSGRSVDKQPIRHLTIHTTQSPSKTTNLAPTLTPTYRNRSVSASRPTIIYIRSS